MTKDEIFPILILVYNLDHRRHSLGTGINGNRRQCCDRTWPVYGGHHIVIFTDNLWMPYRYLAVANVMRSPKL
ncbi:MAG: hypothetical protein EBE86_000985 [Hormoscilla sp. GUM202]|nr:hypothetical protein [Hormoscilla sp. GUM202]